jgi:hypothetical protein
MAASVYRILLAPLLLLALGECTSGPPEPAAAAAPTAYPPGQAHLMLKRTTALANYSARASVEVNGERLGEFGREEGRYKFIPPGKTVVAVAGSSPPGRYAISFNAQAGRSYLLEITSRPEGYAPPADKPVFPYELIENDGAFKLSPAENTAR